MIVTIDHDDKPLIFATLATQILEIKRQNLKNLIWFSLSVHTSWYDLCIIMVETTFLIARWWETDLSKSIALLIIKGFCTNYQGPFLCSDPLLPLGIYFSQLTWIKLPFSFLYWMLVHPHCCIRFVCNFWLFCRARPSASGNYLTYQLEVRMTQ